MSRRFPHLTAQAYFLGLAAINTLHGLLPFMLRPLLYRLARFDIAASATLQGGVRFFHIGRLRIGEGTLINRGVYLDNRAGLSIGRQVSISHDARIYTLGHDVHDPQSAVVPTSTSHSERICCFSGSDAYRVRPPLSPRKCWNVQPS